MSKKDNNNKDKDKKKDNILDLIWDLDLDLDLEEEKNKENQKNNSLKSLKNFKELEILEDNSKTKLKINAEIPTLDKTLLKNEDNLKEDNLKIATNKKERNKNTTQELSKNENNLNVLPTKKNKLREEDKDLLEKLLTNIALLINEEDQKIIKEIKDYFFKNLIKKKFRRLFEININDEIFENNVAFLVKGFGYYYNPYKNTIFDFLFPFDLIYFPLIFDYKKIKINILFREKSIIYILPKSDFILKKLVYKYILKKYNRNILRELNLKNLDTYEKMIFFIYFYLENYYKIDLKTLENINANINANNESNINNINNVDLNFTYYINLPIKRVANFLGISYETLIRNLKKMKNTNLLIEKENKIFINLYQFKDDFYKLQNKLLICKQDI